MHHSSIARTAGLAVVVAILFAASGCTQEKKDLGPQIIIADALAEKSAAATSVKPGDNVILRLPVSGGTGYSWRTANKPSYSWNMMILDDKVESATTEPTAGGAGWQVF